MPRQSRIDFPGALHHIMVRGIDGCDIFADGKDKRFFVDRLGTTLEETATRCYAFALMSNHLHLLLITGQTPISKIMQSLLTGYAVYFNKKHDRAGKLYQNRFKSVLCEKDEYLLELVRYIHLNPLRGGIMPTLDELDLSPWTGHSALMGVKSLSWLESKDILSYFDKRLEPARKAYREFLFEGTAKGHRNDLSGGGLIRSLGGSWEAVKESRSGNREAGDERILGSGSFVEEVLEMTKEKEYRHSLLQREGWDFTALVRHAADAVGVSEADLMMRGRKCARSRGRALLCKWLVVDLGRMQIDVANNLGITGPAVSVLVRRGREIEEDLGITL